MNKNKGRYAALIISVLWMAAVSVLLIILYGLTKYLPLLLCGIVTAMPTAVYAVLMLFCNGLSPASAEQTVCAQTEDEQAVRLYRRVLRSALKVLRTALKGLRGLYFKHRIVAAAVLTVVVCAIAHGIFWLMLQRATTMYTANYLIPVLLAIAFVGNIIFEKWCEHSCAEEDRTSAHLRNLRSGMAMSRLTIVLVAAASVVKLLGIYELLTWVNVAIAVLFCYATLFILMSVAVKIIRRELCDDPDASIPMPFTGKGHRDMSVLGYLEKNTGITMRSLWSIQFGKRMIPYVIVVSVALLWMCSGLVQVESYQTGAVYRLGRLQEQTLSSGLHMTLPWPFDKTVVYDTETVNSTTIGYVSSGNNDNTWTGTHGTEEYRLLLGGGNELVSINLRLEYRISDLNAYLRACSAPEKLLQAKAYELVTARTIGTDLDALLSVDRSAFASDFKEDLAESIEPYDVGLEVVGVVLESIHPPVDIASIYQSVVGAELKAQQYILEAEAAAAVKIASAERQYDSYVNTAHADSYTKIAAAEAEVAEFMASVDADGKYPDSYRYYKYLKAIGSAYGNTRLVIVGEGIDSSNIYFGNLTVLE